MRPSISLIQAPLFVCLLLLCGLSILCNNIKLCRSSCCCHENNMGISVARALVYAAGIIGTGYGLMKFTVPNEQEMRQRLDPHLREEYDKAKARNQQQHQALMEHMRLAAQSDKPAWASGSVPSSNDKPASP
ncbi:CBP4-domain-containing protein [Zychaea mexicana]|uniref:CBP4-domain-containing protein n=1 Tax=Zychaea mexicana TaxID=64656 RepID=UPI0022FF2026|nr:CBP4-domain-containing protein [Zychaea mexicana]KAI9490739.1 CBP4-domain-containing protein [Zychaea mexicana]